MKQAIFAVTSYKFESGIGIPRRIELDGAVYICTELGVRMYIKNRRTHCMLASFTDGKRVFYLRSDVHKGSWELVKVA